MIDFHTHVLSGLDDGAETFKQSVQMVKDLKNQGINTIVLTPHYYFSDLSEESFFEYREKILRELKNEVKDLNVNFVPACEVYLTKTDSTSNLNSFAIKGTRYIMLELPHRTEFNGHIFDMISDVIDYKGLFPIIAHAERYPAVLSRPEIVNQLINMGCLIQLNTSSLFNNKLRRLAYKMLEYNQVHCLGSDCHAQRPSRYQEAKQQIEKMFGRDYFNKLQSNMRTILCNGEIRVMQTKPIRKFFWFYI